MLSLVVFDFDGVFTDGKCYFNEEKINKFYNIKDGMAIKLLKNNHIKTAVLSSYSSSKSVFLNENAIDEEIIEHLSFDLKYIGTDTKLDVLDKWLGELNLQYTNVAYIGDDVNDVAILEKVGFSACPNDAVSECLNVVEYVCSKGGGQGCVREFANKVIEVNKQGLSPTFYINREIREEFLFQINNFDVDGIDKLAQTIHDISGNIYFCGVGKSGNIAKHCCDLLKCISYPSFYLDILNSTHGDIGTLTKNDMVIMFSNSGNTRELLHIVPLFKRIGVKLVGISCNTDSEFGKVADIHLVTPFRKELSGEINKIPTNSFMSHTIFTNILVTILKKNISLDNYRENHLSGTIGKHLLKVKDVLKINYPKIVLEKLESINTIEITKILVIMTDMKIGACFFVTPNDELLGMITDGDIRRLLIKNNHPTFLNKHDVNTTFYSTTETEELVTSIKSDLQKYNYIPVLEENKMIGIISGV